VRADTVPVFLRAEPVQLALQAAVGQEIDRLVETEVLQQTTTLQATSTVSELCDSSAYGLGAVTSHTIADGTTERPIAYGSRTLKPAEINYTPCDTAHYKKYRGGKSCLSSTILQAQGPRKFKEVRNNGSIERCHLYQLHWKSDTRPVISASPTLFNPSSLPTTTYSYYHLKKDIYINQLFILLYKLKRKFLDTTKIVLIKIFIV
jgi:hypothetical protein